MSLKLSTNLKNNPVAEAIRLLKETARHDFQIVIAKDNNLGRQLRDTILDLLGIEERKEDGSPLDRVGDHQVFPLFFPSLEFSPFEQVKTDIVNISERILSRFQFVARCETSKSGQKNIFIIPLPVLLENIELFSDFVKRKLILQTNTKISLESIHVDLHYFGYDQVPKVMDIGQYSIRGSILDVYSPLHDSPLRIEFSGGQVLNIRTFSLEEQRSTSVVKIAKISAASERYVDLPFKDYIEKKVIPEVRVRGEELELATSNIRIIEERLRNGSYFPGNEVFLNQFSLQTGTILNNFPENETTTYFGIENLGQELTISHDILTRDYEQAKIGGLLVPKIGRFIINQDEIKKNLENRKNPLSIGDDEILVEQIDIENEIINSSSIGKKDVEEGIFSQLSWLIKSLSEKKYTILISIGSSQRKKLLLEEFLKQKVSYLNIEKPIDVIARVGSDLVSGVDRIFLASKTFQTGIKIPGLKFVLVTENEIFKTRSITYKKLPFKRSSFRAVISNLSQLSIGDLVVHEMYGIGKFHGLKKIERDEAKGEFLEIEYGGGSRLYVPIQDFSKVGKFQSSDAIPPPLTVLGSGRWEASKQKIKNEIAALTANLLKTYAVRTLMKGFRFFRKTKEENEFASTFAFVETEDQAKAIDDVLSDMESERPMDRLVCGDVGFGKTEVAMRAAFRAIMSGKQVALVAPTTLLVDQHYKNFCERFTDFGVSIGVLNRFRNRKEVKQTLLDLKEGRLDLIIGTHRLLQKDVEFSKLGLLIIDEEHKFGVAQKESLKSFRVEIDVLTLTATPIPRTLQQALHGTRELSVIETAPLGRRPVGIKVGQFSKELFFEAIDREISRGGQVYVVQHYVSGLVDVLKSIKELRPDISCEMAHGKLKGEALSDIMERFYAGTLKVLVSTAIVDSGLDVSNANTIIIIDPQDFGLAQLYQLRGRVGRGDKRAMAYLLYYDYSKLTDDAKRRLAVMESQDSAGNGFKLAMQDMEIRGAGSLFGKDQSGHVQSVGFDMYFKILEEAVAIEKNRRGQVVSDGEDKKLVYDPDLNFGVDLVISEDIVPDLQERLILYQRSLEIDSFKILYDFVEELTDRFGRIDQAVENLLFYMLIRNFARKLLISKIFIRENTVHISLLSESGFMKTAKDKIIGVKILNNSQLKFGIKDLNELAKILGNALIVN